MRDIFLLCFIPIILLIVCWVIGDLVCGVVKKKVDWRGERVIVGFVICTAFFQIIALPFMYLEYDFVPLYHLYITLVFVLLLISIISIYRKIDKNKIVEFKGHILKIRLYKKQIILWGLVILGIAFQIAYVVLHQHVDIDDSFYIAQTNTILETGKVLNIEPASGLAEFSFQPSYKLVGYEVLLAVIVKFFNVNTAFFCHTVLPVFMIALHYLIIINIAKKIDETGALYFALLFEVVNLFSGFSGYSQGAFLLYRIWQGKAVMTNIVVPILILSFLWVWDERKIGWKECVYLTIVLVSGLSTTTVAVYLIPIAYFGLVAGYLFLNRNLWNVAKLCVPVFLILPVVGLKLWILISSVNTTIGAEESIIASAGSGAEELSYTYELIDKFMAGNRVWLICILVALIYVLVKGNPKEKGIIAMPTVILFATFCNPLLIKYVARFVTGSPVYWRVFWLLEFPMIMVTAIAIVVRNIKEREVYGIVSTIGAMLIVVNGSYILNESGFTERENRYKLNNVSLAITDMVLDDAESYEDKNDELV